MSRLGINTGSNANDGQGDTLRAAMGKINSNFLEIYTTLGDTNNVISYASTAGISTVARNLTGNPIVNVGGILNSGITTTEHLEVRNITSTGIVTAVQFVGDGSQLTDVVATNPGVEILDNSVRRGVARELDFGANILVSAPDGQGRVIVTVPTGSESTLYANLAGVSTYASSAGVATYAMSAGTAADLTGTPDVELGNVTAGVVTATGFIGDGSLLTGVTAEGSGVRVENEGVVIGVAQTINFGSTLTVGPLINGKTTISGSGIATGISGSPNVDLGNVISSGNVTASYFYGDGSNLTGIPRGYWTKSVSGLSTTDNVGIGTTAKSNYILDVQGGTGEYVSIAATTITIGNMRHLNGRWLVPNWLNVVSSGDGGVALNRLDDEDFEINGFGKSRFTFQIGTSFYTNNEGVADPKAGVFIDGSRSTVAIGYGITMNGKSGIITATSFVGDGSGLTGIITGGDVVTAVNAGLVGYATEGYVSTYVDDYKTTVGLVTSGYVNNQIAISTFSGDYNDLFNSPTIRAVYVINDLDDVNAPAPSPGQVLKWSGTQWEAASDLVGVGGTGGSGIGLTDLSVTQNSPGIASLTYSNATGVFSYTPPDLTGYATTSSLVGLVSTTDLTGYATTSSLVGLVSTTDLAGYATTSYVTSEIGSYGFATQAFVFEQIGINTFTGAASTITNVDISNWNTAYGWGNHATQGYLTTYNESDTLSSVLSRGNTANNGMSLIGIITATQFIKPGGTSTQFLKADGSSDGNTYLTSESDTLSSVLGRGNTANSDINLTGVITATAFVGDGSGLTGVVGSGSGIVIQEEGSSVGTAGTINFVGTGVTATFSGGIATVEITTTSGGGEVVGSGGTWAVNASGIHTSKNVGIGTELSSSALWVEGNGYFSGIVTATRFESSSAGTPSIDSPNNLNINAINVAISTDLTVGDTLTVGGVVTINSTGLSGSGIHTATSFRTNSTVGDGSDVGFAIKYYVTANGTSAYRFAGPGLLNTTDNPTFYLQRGFTYIFENSTGGTHPFRIQFTGTTTGVGTYVSGSQTGTQVFTVPFDAPSSYQYQCTIHGGMLGTFNVA